MFIQSFSVKLTIIAKETRLNKKQVGISLGFAYTKYKVQAAMFKSATLDLQQKSIKKLQNVTSDFILSTYNYQDFKV